ncbi:uncharacterized protein LOC128193988 [Vigna angularis]|uniref:uncharacterized protein LOC128193988 n=1 Tax=Phaseolus angularis TaxID=3914 RepID=UPI0022B3696E|nr:uncharacterized protein LOC128193988 [Vigna angularis]
MVLQVLCFCFENSSISERREEDRPDEDKLKDMKIREELAPREIGKRTYLPPACYTISRQRKISVCLFFKEYQGTARILFKYEEFSVNARLKACWHEVSRLSRLNATIVTGGYSWNFVQKY